MTTANEDFLARIDKQPEREGGCWIWTGGKNAHGYGTVRSRTRSVYAHRWAYEHFLGPIPGGLPLHHLCERPLCVNPDHLLPVTPAEHSRLHAPNPTHCPEGHPYTPENTYRITTRPGARVCRTCLLARQKQMRDRRDSEQRARRAANRRLKRLQRTPEEIERDRANEVRWKLAARQRREA